MPDLKHNSAKSSARRKQRLPITYLKKGNSYVQYLSLIPIDMQLIKILKVNSLCKIIIQKKKKLS